MVAERIFDVAVAGAGPAGLIAGLACAHSGLRTVVIGPPSGHSDQRTSALFGGSIELLKRLGIWEALRDQSGPVTGVRIVDRKTTFLRAPELFFDCREAGFDAFGYNIPNVALTDALETACTGSLLRLADTISGHEMAGDGITLKLASGETLKARLVIAADGRSSSTRAAAGISVSAWDYPQSALVTTFAHQRDHQNVSTELHRPAGPLTVVPGAGKTSNLVWIETPEEADRLASLDDAAFGHELASELQGLLGALSGFTPRQRFRLSGQTARTFARNRVVVVGEAAHVFPPIGAQGLNLSCRDAATIAEIAEAAKREGADIGGEPVLERYDRARRRDVGTRIFAVDLLNRSLLSTIPGVNLVRGLGLFALASSPALRVRVMREGIMPAASSPALMQALA